MALSNVGTWKHPTVLAASLALVGVLVTGYWQYIYKPAHERSKTVMLAFFVKERGTDKAINNAQVILQRPTRQEEQQTDTFGTARFAVDPDKEQALHVTVHAAGYQDGSQEIDAPKNDGGSYPVYLDSNLCNAFSPYSTTKARVEFVNLSDKKIRVVWHDEDGNEAQPEFKLGPRERSPQETYVGHEWCIFDASSGRFKEAVTILEPQQQIEIR
jgi:hypothetical protein